PRHVASRDPVRAAPGGVADEYRGGARPAAGTRSARGRRREIDQRRGGDPMRGLGRAAAALPLALVLLGALLTGFGGSQQRSLTVLAAASLTESFDELGERFHAEHPDVELRFDYQGSSTLAEQLEQGRRADVFASADPSNMGEVVDGVGVERPPAVFA